MVLFGPQKTKTLYTSIDYYTVITLKALVFAQGFCDFLTPSRMILGFLFSQKKRCWDFSMKPPFKTPTQHPLFFFNISNKNFFSKNFFSNNNIIQPKITMNQTKILFLIKNIKLFNLIQKFLFKFMIINLR